MWLTVFNFKSAQTSYGRQAKMSKQVKILCVVFSCAIVAAAQTGAERPTPNTGSKAPPIAQGANSSSPAGPPDKKDDECGCSLAAPDVLAIVNGVKISGREIDEQIKGDLDALKRQVVEARERELDLQINSRLLELEARRRGTTPIKLLEQEVMAKVKEPTEAEAQAFYNQYKNQTAREFAEEKNDVIAHLRYQREQDGAKAFADRLRAATQIKLSVPDYAAPASDADRTRVVAVVGAERITLREIEDAIRTLNFKAQEQAYGLRKKRLEVKINDVLLEQEAKRRSMTVAALLESEVTSKASKITDERLRAFYELNKTNLKGDYAQLKEPLAEYLQSREKNMAEEAFAAEMRRRAAIQSFLAEPSPPVYTINIDDQPVKGNPSAPVTIVEFTDYQCPSCASLQPAVESLLKEFGDKARLVVRDFPLRQHADAFKAAEAAEAAREQGKYWEYAALLYSNRSALAVEDLKKYAGQLGLDRQLFDQALASGKFADQVRRDLQDGMKVGVYSTPAFFINGKQVPAKTYETLKQALEAALEAETKLKTTSKP
jgi:protein-disulfide isomerase